MLSDGGSSGAPRDRRLAPGKPHEGDHDEDADADADRKPSPVRAPETSRGAEGEAGELDRHLRGL